MLTEFFAAIEDGRIDVIDLTAPLSERTPIIQLPPPFANTRRFELSQISHYDERGPGWYWNDISTGEHVGTHFDAPIHWVTGRDNKDVSEVPARQLIAPAVVIDKSRECAETPIISSRSRTSRPGSVSTAPCPTGDGSCTERAGTRGPVTSRDFSTPTTWARTRRGSRSNARAGWRTKRPCSGSAWRRSAPTPARRTASSPRFPVTHSCLARASTG